ncbi:HD domain-containing phosphohydrolase [Salidesulfovibrio brasiliensis]|uniref:HD domain-containing phosphohydrolase n=1 Tax=Salidesulfovibrio brasiliensis TaxID=221711 RepID=UPI0006CFEF4C|nr:HD domain-containing phosphohydrolase [Salidesulfovibrio brasiliensis]
MHVKIIDLMVGISGALDLISPEVVGHHRRTAEIATTLAHSLNLPEKDLGDLYLAALLHDIGAFSLKSRIDALDFEFSDIRHAELGYRLVARVPHLQRPARLIRLHHTPWNGIGEDVPADEALLANILNLADRVDAADGQPEHIDRLHRLSGTVFSPRTLSTLTRDILILHHKLGSGSKGSWKDTLEDTIIPQSELLDFADAFSHVIDFRSRFTATHSCGVAETAAALGRLAGLSETETRTLKLAGLLHDIGKLAVPSEIIEKKGGLTDSEFEIVRSHPGICETILSGISGFADISHWACQHHERLNGRGYPHGLLASQLSTGSRIMAVADVFTALTEDRPYRAGMSKSQALEVLGSMSTSGFLDPTHVSLLHKHYENIDTIRVESQSVAMKRFCSLAA